MNIFQNISLGRPKSSAFNLTHARKFSFVPGILTPTLCQEVLPSDRWTASNSALIRFQPLVFPTMHLVDVFSYSFNVPARLCMKRGTFETFITGGNKGDGKDASGHLVKIPTCRFSLAVSSADELNATTRLHDGSLADFLGIGQIDFSGTDSVDINFMPFIAFWRIWCEYFRDQNLHPNYVELYPGIFDAEGQITPAVFAAENDPDNPFRWYDLPQVCWEKDAFTSALPFAQRGNPVETPLSGTATVTYKNPATARVVAGSAAPAGDIKAAAFSGTDDSTLYNVSTEPIQIENIDEVNVDTGGFTINALRLAARLQEWLERMARGGARYIEQIKSHFGVTSSDARLQRPEYLSGGKIPVSISEILQIESNSATPLGEMAGHAIAAGNVTHFSKFFEEHSFIISVMFLRPKTAYQQGVPRMFTQRFDKLNWGWPTFAHLGEQEVKTSEVYMSFDEPQNNITFGYQQRYYEYKYIPSTVHGQFRASLAPWHWGRIFNSVPTLSPEFMACDPSPRIFNVITGGEPLYAIVNNKINCVRPLPYYGEPTL